MKQMPNIPYDRPGRQRQYLSIQKHHRTSRKKNASKWESVIKEKENFDIADFGNFSKTLGNQSWEDDNQNLWGFLPDFEVVGTRGEQFGFFPKPTNTHDRWHGYPIIPFKGGHNISSNLLEVWIDQELIDSDDVSTLMGGKIL